MARGELSEESFRQKVSESTPVPVTLELGGRRPLSMTLDPDDVARYRDDPPYSPSESEDLIEYARDGPNRPPRFDVNNIVRLCIRDVRMNFPPRPDAH